MGLEVGYFRLSRLNLFGVRLVSIFPNAVIPQSRYIDIFFRRVDLVY